MRQDKIVAIQDTREQLPLNLEKYGLCVVRQKLDYGDYSLKVPNLVREIAIERKSLPDFISCWGKERPRFERELLALRGFKHKMVVVESSLSEIFSHKYRSKIAPQAVIGSIVRWNAQGINFFFCEDHDKASYVVTKTLQMIAQDYLEAAKIALAIDKTGEVDKKVA